LLLGFEFRNFIIGSKWLEVVAALEEVEAGDELVCELKNEVLLVRRNAMCCGRRYLVDGFL